MSEEWGWIRGDFLQKKVMCKQMSDDRKQQSLQMLEEECSWHRSSKGGAKPGAFGSPQEGHCSWRSQEPRLEGMRLEFGSWGQMAWEGKAAVGKL